MQIHVIGKGSFGKKRIEAIKQVGKSTDYKTAEAVIVCVPTKFHKELTIKALKDGKHVLCEKPFAMNVKEAEEMVKVANETGKFLKIGSNHRFFKNILEAHKKNIGNMLSFDGFIGHNGKRIKNTWYWDKSLSGGGTLIDTGWHMIDLARWFMGDLNFLCKTLLKQDEANISLVAKSGRIARVRSSWKHNGEYIKIKILGNQ